MPLVNIYSVIPAMGVDYEATVTLNDGTENYNFKPGDVSIDNQGGHWIFAKANEALSAYELCKLSSAAIPLAIAAAAADIDAVVPILGIPQVDIASGDYGWFWRGPGGGVGRGIKVLAAANCAQDKLLFATATDGVVDDAVVTDDAIAGLFICATITTAAAAECYATTFIAANLDEGVA
jgi:hypothetical protein